jgi:hypothetical protein
MTRNNPSGKPNCWSRVARPSSHPSDFGWQRPGTMPCLATRFSILIAARRLDRRQCGNAIYLFPDVNTRRSPRCATLFRFNRRLHFDLIDGFPILSPMVADDRPRSGSGYCFFSVVEARDSGARPVEEDGMLSRSDLIKSAAVGLLTLSSHGAWAQKTKISYRQG